MEYFHGKYCSDFSLEEGGSGGEREKDLDEQRGKRQNKKTKPTQNNSNGNQDSKSNKISDDDGFFISTKEDDRIVLFLVQNYNVQRQPTFT